MSKTSQRSLSIDTPVQYVKGIGPKRAELLGRVGVETVEDLLYYLPRRYLDRSRIAKIRSLIVGEEVTVVGKILACGVKRGRASRFVVTVGDDTGLLQCVWFRGLTYISKVFHAGETVAFSGKVTMYRSPQMVHPEYDKISEEGESNPLHTGGIVPMYPSTDFLTRGGLDSRGFRRVLHTALNQIGEAVPETLSDEVLKNRRLIPLDQALQNIHFPRDWGMFSEAQKRLKFEELFFIQLFLALHRKHREIEQNGISFSRVGDKTRWFLESLPFEMTEAQKRVLKDIREDMKSTRSMNRLLQGDVGAGKTVVALTAMLVAVENGYQAALMSPTEILAEQHFKTIFRLLEGSGITIVLLKGGQKAMERRDILCGLEKGDFDIVVGTHALVQEGVEFKNLGFVVIDEQHRFGVMQRANLRRKGVTPDVLVMTATPIPRTLALTLYGDLDISILDELPKGRRPVRTVWRKEESRGAIYDFMRDELRKGRQAYVVYPLVEESEKMDLADATAGYEKLANHVFSDFRVALLHGRMKSEEKEAVMKDFLAGEIHVLVSTTVIEVGIDVPNATVMLVEHGERFGLTQLHQLRGRIGRGSEESTCILMTQGFLSDDALKRVQTMVKTNDGFRIAEMDLQIRGPGELYGTRQHGSLSLRIANLATDGRILDAARKEAFDLIEEDGRLEKPQNRMIRETYMKRYEGKFGLMKVG